MHPPPAGGARKDVMNPVGHDLLLARNRGESGTKAAKTRQTTIESLVLRKYHDRGMELSSRRCVWAPAKRGQVMSTYILAIGGNAKLGVDTSVIDEDDDIQSDDFSFVLGDHRDIPMERSSTEVEGEVMITLAGSVH